MLFEWDPNKSAHNSEKHGIDFDEARWLWGDANRVEACRHHQARRGDSYHFREAGNQKGGGAL